MKHIKLARPKDAVEIHGWYQWVDLETDELQGLRITTGTGSYFPYCPDEVEEIRKLIAHLQSWVDTGEIK